MAAICKTTLLTLKYRHSTEHRQTLFWLTSVLVSEVLGIWVLATHEAGQYRGLFL